MATRIPRLLLVVLLVAIAFSVARRGEPAAADQVCTINPFASSSSTAITCSGGQPSTPTPSYPQTPGSQCIINPLAPSSLSAFNCSGSQPTNPCTSLNQYCGTSGNPCGTFGTNSVNVLPSATLYNSSCTSNPPPCTTGTTGITVLTGLSSAPACPGTTQYCPSLGTSIPISQTCPPQLQTILRAPTVTISCNPTVFSVLQSTTCIANATTNNPGATIQAPIVSAPGAGGPGGSYSFSSPGSYTITATATDSLGQSGQASTTVTVTPGQQVNPLPQPNPPAFTPSLPPPAVTSVYCTPPLSSSGGTSCPFVLQVVSGNDIPRISGREAQPPVSIDRTLTGATLTVTLTNNTVDGLDLSHTNIVRTAPRITPANPRASTGNASVQGNAVTHDGFSLPSGGTATLTVDLQPDSGQALPSSPVDAIRAVDLTGVDAQTGKLLAELGGKGMMITIKAGWNLVGGPTGTLLNLPPEALFTIQGGDRGYQVVGTEQALQGGNGYWDQVNEDRTEILRVTDPQTITRSLPAGQWVMIGNPGTTPAMVSGADQIVTFDPVNQYRATTMLQPGQGAWAVSLDGGLATIANMPEAR